MPDLIQNFQDHDGRSYDGLVVFGLSGNGDYVCFDYRHGLSTCSPRISIMLHDDYEKDDHGDLKMTIFYVASNFEEFIELLF